VPFSGDPATLLNSILDDIAKIEEFTQGVDRRIFEEDDRVAYAVNMRCCESAKRHTDWETEPQRYALAWSGVT
jgi:uncharacterized protein with HEPN domain